MRNYEKLRKAGCMLNAATIIDDIQNLLAQERITERDAYDYINGDEKAVLWYY